MGTARTPAGTRIYMQSAISSAQVLSGISKAAQAVVTYVGTDPATGNYAALIDQFGMTEFEDALVKVGTVDSGLNTFVAEDQDSSGYGTFATGNMKVVTMALEIGDGTGFTINGFDQQFAEYNLLRDRITRKIPTTVSAGGIDIPMLWDPTDATAKAIRVAADTSAKLGFKVVFPDGLEMLFFGYIGASGMPKVDNNNSIIMTNVSISMATRPRYVLP